MKKVLLGLLVVSVLFLTGCSVNLEQGYKEGIYEGSVEDVYGGQTNQATAKITVDSTGKITDVYLDTTYTPQDGVLTTKKALKEAYGMKKGNSSFGTAELEWFEQVEKLEQSIIDNQGTDKLNLDSDGYTDAVSGCTIKIDALVAATNKALEQAK